MTRRLTDLIPAGEVQDFRMFLYELSQKPNRYLLRNDIVLAFEQYCHDNDKPGLLQGSSLHHLFSHIPELLLLDGMAILVHRYQMARYLIYKIGIQGEAVDQIDLVEFLNLRDKLAQPDQREHEGRLRVNFLPFYDYGPTLTDVKNVGRGISSLNRYMSSNLFNDPEKWNQYLFEFLKIHSLGGQQLLIDGNDIHSLSQLIEEIQAVTDHLATLDAETPLEHVIGHLRRHGFEPGWGNSAGKITETMNLLLELFQSPDGSNVERFISRIPMISKVAIISPHGWFGQTSVLGRPDTGGQVVYILDQVRALEKTLAQRLHEYGLNAKPKIIVVTRLIPDHQGTTSNIRLERIHQTDDTWILRVPFHDRNDQVIPHWISRFEIWPYLQRFAHEAKLALLSEFNGRPDLIIGNYTDGNLVATLLSEELDVIQCNIAHALEKTKYLFSDLYWQSFEPAYHFSLQYVADLIAMNMADFIITSTFQEIAGTSWTRGQYESYQFFSMPGLMQVENGVNLFHPKFNVIPPGVDENVFFPFHAEDRRLPNRRKKLAELMFEVQNETSVGALYDQMKIPIFTMARLDRVKNLTMLVESFGKSPPLQEKCNLIVIAGKVDAAKTSDVEEAGEIRRMHELMREFQLHGKMRWLGIHLSKDDTGAAYRIIADQRGVFVQPARFEAFGLTVLEAMASGLPVFATQFGGPSEIIQDKKSGFLINPTAPEFISAALLEFLARCEREPDCWQQISTGAIARVQERFTWQLYSNKLLDLTALYGFWRYAVANTGKRELSQYCHVLFQLLFKERAKAIMP
ncbi:MAG: sucrose synthase [bacterium]